MYVLIYFIRQKMANPWLSILYVLNVMGTIGKKKCYYPVLEKAPVQSSQGLLYVLQQSAWERPVLGRVL